MHSTHFVSVFTYETHGGYPANEAIHILVHMTKERTFQTRVFHVSIVPYEQLQRRLWSAKKGAGRTTVKRTSSRMNSDKVPDRSNSGAVRHLAIAVHVPVMTPSTPARVAKCCILGVRRKGTASEELISGCPGAKAT